MLTEVNVQQHITKTRAPDSIMESVSHYIGEAHGTSVRTANWGQLRFWYLNNKHRHILRIVAMCEQSEEAAHF